ncbi:hypothetical protein ACVWZV_000247 [Bradyrhizobium sp. GM5.1]
MVIPMSQLVACAEFSPRILDAFVDVDDGSVTEADDLSLAADKPRGSGLRLPRKML